MNATGPIQVISTPCDRRNPIEQELAVTVNPGSLVADVEEAVRDEARGLSVSQLPPRIFETVFLLLLSYLGRFPKHRTTWRYVFAQRIRKLILQEPDPPRFELLPNLRAVSAHSIQPDGSDRFWPFGSQLGALFAELTQADYHLLRMHRLNFHPETMARVLQRSVGEVLRRRDELLCLLQRKHDQHERAIYENRSGSVDDR